MVKRKLGNLTIEMAAPMKEKYLLAVEIEECPHHPEKRKKLAEFSTKWTFEDVFRSFHIQPVDRLETTVSISINGENSYEVLHCLHFCFDMTNSLWIYCICETDTTLKKKNFT